MKLLAGVLFCLMILSGCGRKQAPVAQWPTAGFAGATTNSNSGEKVVITPEKSLVGKVAKVNVTARFVVLNFPVGRLPALEQRLQVYRGGLKVGELKVTGPQLDDAIVADVTTGDAEAGDEVRDQ